MTLKQIEYFLAVCKRQSISTAADDLFISRSVVSRAIADLEYEFNTQIFVRSRNGVTLTESGQVLVKLFETFLSICNAAKDRIEMIRIDNIDHPLRIGITPTNAYGVYEKYIEIFHIKKPSIPIHIKEYSANEGLSPLLEGKLDAFFTPIRPDASLFEMIDLYDNPIMLGASNNNCQLTKNSIIGITDLVDLPLGFYNAPMPIEDNINTMFKALGRKPNIVLRTSDQSLLYKLTKKGDLYPILPLDMMISWNGVNRISLDFVNPVANRLIWSKAIPLSSSMVEFITFMNEQPL